MSQSTWQPHDSLTKAPTNLKEAIDWVLRVTGRDGKENKAAAQPPNKDSGPHCLCFLAKAVKDLLYDARSPGSPGPTTDRYWDDLLLPEESTIVKPVLEDLGLVHSGSTSAARDTCAGGTEVIKALIEQLAQGLQKWVGWQEEKSGKDVCCLNTDKGIGKKCTCTGSGGTGCCSPGGSGSTTPCHDCGTCGTSASSGNNKCYLSAYCKKAASSGGGSNTEGDYYWPTISNDSTKVHLLARIFLGSVCLIWSGLSQLGFLTGDGKRWKESKLHEIETGDSKGLGSFMAAMGYDLDRLNQGKGKKGTDVFGMLKGGFSYLGDGTDKGSVAEYYSSIYDTAKTALSGKKTEEICKQYPLLVLHILASGYFRAGSAGAKGVTTPPKAAGSTSQSATTSDPKKDTVPRKPRTIREILYWLSALPYSKGYKTLVERMQQKYPPKEGELEEQIELYSDTSASKASTTLQRKDITHYLMAACGYCPLVLIGIQGTIEKEVDKAQPAAQGSAPAAAADQKKCPKHKDNRHKRCTVDDKDKAPAAPAAPAAAVNGKLQPGEVCYGGYHLAVSSFGPLHGMYANGLFGFDMDLSAAQCLDQLRIYVYHCFYQLYFLRKQCKVGVVAGVGGAAGKTVLGWKSCRYGSGVNPSGGVSNQNPWRCEAPGSGNDCQCKKTAGHQSPLMYFLCDGLGPLVCKKTVGVGLGSNKQSYPEIDAHMNKTVDSKGKEHEPHRQYPQLCPVPMGWSAETGTGNTQQRENHFKDLSNTHKTLQLSQQQQAGKYPAHCTGNTLSLLLEYYCDPEKCHGTLVVLLRLLACITPTVPRTLGDLFGFYYYIVYIGGKQGGGGGQGMHEKLQKELQDVRLSMLGSGNDAVVSALTGWSGDCSNGTQNGNLKCLYKCPNSGTGQCCQYLSPLSGQQYGQLSPVMAGTYLSWLVYLIGEFEEGLKGLAKDYRGISCANDGCSTGNTGAGCGADCRQGSHGNTCSGGSGSGGVCKCTSVVSCTGVLPVLYKYGFGYGNVTELHSTKGTQKKCDAFLTTLTNVEEGQKFKDLTTSINQLIYTTRLPWIFVLTLAWLVAVLYLAFGAIWPLDWTHMRSHCRGWFRKGSLSPWEILMVGKKKGRGILEFFGRT